MTSSLMRAGTTLAVPVFKRVDLDRRGSFLLVGRSASGVRLSFWRRREPGEQRDRPPLQVFDALKGLGVFKPAASVEGWCRVAVERETLGDALFVAMSDSVHEWRTVEAYIRATGWGAELP